MNRIISSVRLGFATNSSSSHSIVLSKHRYDTQPAYTPGNYGWDQFTLADETTKLEYLGTALYMSACRFLDKEQAALVAGSLVGLPSDFFIDSYIDHESAFYPSNLAQGAKDYVELFTHPDVVVFGGNDNSDTRELADGEVEVSLSRLTDLKIKRDKGSIVIFNKNSGTKIRWDNGSYTKATVPELVDLKITDYCPYGCVFCYQSSTKRGEDASFANLYGIITKLGKMGVLEVALGGGETTASRHFASIIDLCIDSDIVPNFTTFGVDWIADAKKLAAANKCGGIGVSVHNISQIDKAVKIKDAVKGPIVMAQHVVGTLPTVEDTVALIAEAWKKGVSVLLLGYKNVGFGVGVKEVKYDVDTFSKLLSEAWDNTTYGVSLSCDTAFIENYKTLLSTLDIPVQLTTSPEGAFSCYIDAVKMEMGPSSYCDEESMTPLIINTYEDDWSKVFLGVFAKY